MKLSLPHKAFALFAIALPLVSLVGCRTTDSRIVALARDVPAHAATPAPQQAGPPIFVDVAESAGLHYRWQIAGKRPLNILQSIGNGCAFLDYDNDGFLDILLVGPKLALYKGDGKGHFTDVTAAVGLEKFSGHFLGCAVGDYDNDGYDDVYISGYRTGLLLHNEGGRRFRDATTEAGLKPQPWGSSASFADLDGDGRLDLYVCNYARFGPDTKPQLCDNHGIPSACGPRSYRPEYGVLYHNEGRGRFRDVTRAWHADKVSGYALGAAVADYDHSGQQSLAIANDQAPGDLLHRQGAALANVGQASGMAYSASGSVYGGMGIDWGDYDNDGKLDLVIATYQDQAKCVFHSEGRTFTEQSARLGLAPAIPYVTFGAKWLDFDNDGWLDLMLANGHVQDNVAEVNALWGGLKTGSYREPTQLFHNLKGARFDDVSARLGGNASRPIVGRGLALGDFDNDGRVDALVADSEGAPLLLHNVSAPVGHWLLFKLIGTGSNRDGIGALLTVEAAGRTLLRRCATDGSYLSASDKRVHVGLGRATRATVRVRWPDGKTQVYANIAADRIVTLREGD